MFEDDVRRTGRSTRIALSLISSARNSPGIYFEIVDHYPTREACRHLAYLIQDLLSKMELRGFKVTFGQGRQTIVYNGLHKG